jgi:hypothetical protein
MKDRLELPSGENLVHSTTLHIQGPNGISGSFSVPPWDGSSRGWLGISTGPRDILHLRSLRLGGREFRDIPVVETERDALLGRDVLGTFDWILCGPSKELLLLMPR